LYLFVGNVGKLFLFLRPIIFFSYCLFVDVVDLQSILS